MLKLVDVKNADHKIRDRNVSELALEQFYYETRATFERCSTH